MKFILIIILAASALFSAAQSNTTVKRKIDDKTIVVDSSGMQYIYAVWVKLFQTGDYGLKAVNPADETSPMLLYKLTEEEKQKRDENAPMPKESKFFTTGAEFGSFKLKNMKGKKFDSKSLKDKVVVFNFWFINCPPCKTEIPHLNKVVEEFKDKDVVFIAVALDQYNELQDFLEKTPFNYEIIDDGRNFAAYYGITSYPTHVVVDKQGKIAYHTSGLSTGTIPWLKKTITTLLESKN